VNISDIYYVCVCQIIDKKYVLGEYGYLCECKSRPLANRYVYKKGYGYIYIDLKIENEYELLSKKSDVEVGKIYIDDKNYAMINFKDALVLHNLQHEESQIKIKNNMSKRKILKMINGGKKWKKYLN